MFAFLCHKAATLKQPTFDHLTLHTTRPQKDDNFPFEQGSTKATLGDKDNLSRVEFKTADIDDRTAENERESKVKSERVIG